MADFDTTVHYNNRTLTDWVCQRERYLTFEKGGKAVELEKAPYPLGEDFAKQRSHRENEVKLAMDLLDKFREDPEAVRNILNTAFPQNLNACDLPDGICEHHETCFPGGEVGGQS